MNDLLKKFDGWLEDTGPAALVIREHLMPVEGRDGVLFPATFAASEDKTFKGGYNIDEFPDGKNICLIDSVGSQANRIEPLFMKKDYAGLVPQIIIKAGNKKVNLLEAGHRAGDAIVRCSSLQKELQDAFRAVLNGDCWPLAKIAPTSLVFGAWDSRDTQAKLPRLIASTIRAFDVRKLTRSAQYVPATAYVEQGLLEEPADKKTKKAYAERGFVHVPAPGSHGGVIATGSILRDVSLHLAALRMLSAGEDAKKTLTLRRYIFGLAMVAFTYPSAGYLRQGCNLVLDPDKKKEFTTVHSDGKRENATPTHNDAREYAKSAAEVFGIGTDREVPFDKELAIKDVSRDATDGNQKPKKTRSKKTE
ncbi:MAG TPA: type I-U CRISPR-associated RAMP protein Csb1/Cas7u [Myxococcota bacterium]|nr:type I-U CRISPR-associated RAMP protein Csb1/Cas7u [Myxococcota bacterium]